VLKKDLGTKISQTGINWKYVMRHFYGHLQKQEEKDAEIKPLQYTIKRIVPKIN
jgi:hypothetical protein